MKNIVILQTVHELAAKMKHVYKIKKQQEQSELVNNFRMKRSLSKFVTNIKHKLITDFKIIPANKFQVLELDPVVGNIKRTIYCPIKFEKCFASPHFTVLIYMYMDGMYVYIM